MKFGDDKAISLGGALPTEHANGLPAIYDQLRKTDGPWLAVICFTTDYVKVYPGGLKPDEPVLKLLRIEVPDGEDALALNEMILRLNAERTAEPETATQATLPTE